MPDVVVTVPKSFGLATWIAEGDPAGEPESGIEWYFTLGGLSSPKITPGERVYIVYNNKLRGYAPLFKLIRYADEWDAAGELGDLDECPPRRRIPGFALVRKGGAVAVTIDEPIRGFQGFRYRWWERALEVPFPGWRQP